MHNKTEEPKYAKNEDNYAMLPGKALKKEEPDPKKYDIALEQKKEQQILERFQKSPRYDNGILTNHKNYEQPQAMGISDIYMLNPKTLQYHIDPNLALRNYVRIPSNVNFGYNTAATGYKTTAASYGGKKAS